MKADLVALDPSFDALVESDPAIKVIEIAAYREFLIRQRINEAARACMVAYAMGSDLDQLAAIFGVERLEIAPADPQAGTPAILESDEDLRRRVLLAPDSYSVAGPSSAYVFHALSADPDVLDASAISPAPGHVLVSVLSRHGDGTADAELVASVAAALSADDVRPLTDAVAVQTAVLVNFRVEAELTLYAGPDSQLILLTATTALENLLQDSRRLGRDVTRSAIMAALHVAGVQNVTLTHPAVNVEVDETQIANSTGTTIRISGTGE